MHYALVAHASKETDVNLISRNFFNNTISLYFNFGVLNHNVVVIPCHDRKSVPKTVTVIVIAKINSSRIVSLVPMSSVGRMQPSFCLVELRVKPLIRTSCKHFSSSIYKLTVHVLPNWLTNGPTDQPTMLFIIY